MAIEALMVPATATTYNIRYSRGIGQKVLKKIGAFPGNIRALQPEIHENNVGLYAVAGWGEVAYGEV